MPINDRPGAGFGNENRDALDYEGADLYEDDEEDELYQRENAQRMQPLGMSAPSMPPMPPMPPAARSIPVTTGPAPMRMPPQTMAGSAPEPASAQTVTVAAQGLSKSFVAGGEVVQAVDNVSFSLTTRQFVAITGPSGCGKTTLLYMLGSLEQPTAGSVIIDGVDVAALTPEAADQFRRKSIGFVFQSFYLIPNLSALENVTLPMEIARVPRRFRRERAEYLLQQVGLDKNRHTHLPSKLSGGQQQRVAIARALANDPSVILADEPTGNRDSNNSKRLVSLLRTLARQGRTIIMVTHDRGIARLADVRMDLVDGRIVRITTPAETGGQRGGAPASQRQANTPRNGPPAYGQPGQPS